MIKNNKKIFVTICLFLVVAAISIVGASYAYFRAVILGSGTSNLLVAGEVVLEFIDDNANTLNSVSPGTVVTRNMSVENTSDKATYYKIGWDSLSNNYLRDELTIELKCKQFINYGDPEQEESGTCKGLEEEPIGSDLYYFLENIYIGYGYTHEYEVIVKFLDNNTAQSKYDASGMLKTFRGIIDVTGSIKENLWYEHCAGSDSLNCKIINSTGNVLKSDAYLNISPADVGTGTLYYTYDKSDTYDINNDGLGERIYYYRGNVNNNYVSFGGYCWKIFRTNEDGSVRMRYNGPLNGGACVQTKTAVAEIESKYGFYNYYSTDARHVGYMFGDTCDTYENCTQNINDSDIKSAIDLWYETYLIDYTDQISDEIFCNDRTIASGAKYFALNNSKTGYGTGVTVYGAAERLNAVGGTTYAQLSVTTPTFKCPRVEDSFTVSEIKGNGDLKYPIGLITADEAKISGMVITATTGTTSPFLNNNVSYWTMTPFYQQGATPTLYLINKDVISYSGSTSNQLILPVISLKSNVAVTSGTGLYNSPYLIES